MEISLKVRGEGLFYAAPKGGWNLSLFLISFYVMHY